MKKTIAPNDLETVSKQIVRSLQILRQKSKMIDEQNLFLPKITAWINETKALGKATPSQVEETILYVIEKQQAETLSDICDDLKLDRAFIEEKLDNMIKGGMIRKVLKHVPGMYKKTYLFKSNRLKTPEAA